MADIPTVIAASATTLAGSEGVKFLFRWLKAREERLSREHDDDQEDAHARQISVLKDRITKLEYDLNSVKEDTALIAKAIDTITEISILLREVIKPRLEEYKKDLIDVDRRLRSLESRRS